MKISKFIALSTIFVAAFSFVSCSSDDDDESNSKAGEFENATNPSNRAKNANHEFVDLGLPSGTLWASCNIGAEKPEDFGNYFAWGEVEPKKAYSWSSYKWMNKKQGENLELQVNKYTCADHNGGAFWYSGDTFTGDGVMELKPEDDAATVNWGSDWCMPSSEQIKELINSDNTTTVLTTQKEVNGLLITSKKNNKSIFLPATGFYNEDYLIGSHSEDGLSGAYWTRSLCPYYSYDVFILRFSQDDITLTDAWARCFGQPVRPVRSSK